MPIVRSGNAKSRRWLPAHVAAFTGTASRGCLEYESSSNLKHEYVDGDIYAMAAGTMARRHERHVSSSLNLQLRDTACVVASSDLKVRVLATGLATYPDVTVVCGPIERDPKSRDVILNPTLVVSRRPDGSWITHVAGPGETAALPGVGCSLPVEDVYRNGDVSG
jgi:hypothetical protein